MSLPGPIAGAIDTIGAGIRNLSPNELAELRNRLDYLAHLCYMAGPVSPSGVGRQVPDHQAERARLGNPVPWHGNPT